MSTTVLQGRPITTESATTPRSPTLAQRIWNAMVASGQRRAAAELRRLAVIHRDGNPQLSRQLSDAADYASNA